MNASINNFDVIIVGAGLSGLRCAHNLVKHDTGLKVLVLEARNRVGGRTETSKIGKDKIDFGAQWIGPTQHKISSLVKEFGIETFPQVYGPGKSILTLHTNKRITFEESIPSIPSIIPFIPSYLTQWDTKQIMRKLNQMAKLVSPIDPWNSPNAKQLDSISFQTWLDQNCWTMEANDFIHISNSNVFATESRDLSLLFVLFYIASAGGKYEDLLDSETSAQATRVVGGCQQISEKLFASIQSLGGTIKLNNAVRLIERNEKEVIVHTTILNPDQPYISDKESSQVYKAKRIVIAAPPAMANRIQYYPPLPALRDQLSQRMQMGSIIKTFVTYKTAWWRNKGYSGTVICCCNRPDWPVYLVFDEGDQEHKHLSPSLLGFIQGDAVKEWQTKTKEERRDAILKEYAELFQSEEAKDFEEYEEKLWGSDEWSRGCYTGIMGPGTLTTCGKALREPIDRIHWAGTETATSWMGYMEGALDAADRASDEVKKALTDPFFYSKPIAKL